MQTDFLKRNDLRITAWRNFLDGMFFLNAEASSQSPVESWRVVVFTMVVDGLVYKLVESALQPLGHRVVGVVTTPGPISRRNTDYPSVVSAVPRGVDVLVSTHPSRWAAMLAPLRPDLIVSGGFPYRIPPDVVKLPRLGAINLHSALLPRLRGPAPLQWVFRNGDAEAGSTVHRISPDFDAGPILAQASVPVTDDDNGATLLAKLLPPAVQLLVEAFAKVAAGDPGEPQDEAEASYAPRFEASWREVDWQQPARTIHNQVRSWDEVIGGSGGAFAEIGGERFLVTRTRLLPGGADGGSPPGTILQDDADGLVVQCGDLPIAILEREPVESA